MRLVGFWVVLCCMGGCQVSKYRVDEGKVYGTYFHINYESSVDYGQEIRFEMNRVNRSLSMFNPQSVVAKLNRNVCDSVDMLFEQLFIEAQKVYQATDGAFDITVAPLANAWGFGFEHEQFPDSVKVDSLLQFVGMDKLKVDNKKLVKANPGIQIDASALAKGLGVDLVANFLEKKGVANYMVEIGGEIRVKGVNAKGKAWRIGVDKPIDEVAATRREIALIVGLSKGALATSGNYRNFHVVNGKKYAHIINPKTGFPVQRDILSASVYAKNCMKADAYATSFMVLGLKASCKIVQEDSELEACFIYENERGECVIWMSDGFEKMKVSE